MENFKTEPRNEADGGDVTQGQPMNMTVSEYSRQNGSDGFSKTGGKGNGFSK